MVHVVNRPLIGMWRKESFDAKPIDRELG